MGTKDDLAAFESRLRATQEAAMAEIDARLAESHADLMAALHQGFAEAAKERAEIIKVQARQLYVIVATIAAATISIWIALFTMTLG